MLQLLASKVEETGCKLIALDTRKVALSQVCPVCRARRKKVLAERKYECECGFRAGRDEAAALYMLAVGLSQEGRETSWVQSPETPTRAA